MSAYATVEDVQARMQRDMTVDEQSLCETLLEDAGVRIDAYKPNAPEDAKKIVSCRMVIRVVETGADNDVPVGASQGSMSALGYTQSWTLPGTLGELYLNKEDKRILGDTSTIGSRSPIEDLVPEGVI
jgi:hypothetical protein